MKTGGSAGHSLVWLVAVVALARLAMLGLYPLQDTTEARYAEIARKMAELNDWVTPWFNYGVPFWGKPPMSFWLTSASFKLFGVNEFAARLPHLLAALLVSWLVWDWMRQRSPREAMLAIALLWGAALFYVSAGAVMTDMVFAIGTTLAMRGFWLGLHGSEPQRRRERWLLFIGLGIGLLAKGPIALVLSGLPITLWSLATRNAGMAWQRLPWMSGSLIVAVLAVPWYVIAELKTPGFLDYFLIGEHWQRFTVVGWSGDRYGKAHAFPNGSIWLFAVVACLPWTLLWPVLAFGRAKAVTPNPVARTERAWRTYLLVWGAAPCLFFTVAGNILWTYVLPGLPALAMFSATWLASDTRTRRVDIVVASGMIVMALGMSIAVASLNKPNNRNTAKSLVKAYHARKAGKEPLIFLETRPYSASFYSQGEAKQANDMVELKARLEHGRAFVALKEKQQQDLPSEVQSKLHSEGHYGNYELYSVIFTKKTNLTLGINFVALQDFRSVDAVKPLENDCLSRIVC